MKQETKKYIFDDACECVYEIDDNNYYAAIGSYYSYNITKDMSYEQAAGKVEECEDNVGF